MICLTTQLNLLFVRLKQSMEGKGRTQRILREKLKTMITLCEKNELNTTALMSPLALMRLRLTD